MARPKKAKDFAEFDLTSLAKDVPNTYAGGIDTQSEIRYLIPTGCSLLDKAIGGGIPTGRVMEIYGKESSGKSSLAMHIIANCQKMGGMAVMIDQEHSWDWARAKELGINKDQMIYSDPPTLEDTLQNIEAYVTKFGEVSESERKPVVIIWDTIAAAPTRHELDDNVYAGGMGYAPRILRQGLRKLTRPLAKADVALILLNQTIASFARFGASETTPGGGAPKFFSSTRLSLRKKAQTDDGQIIAVTVTKSKLRAPMAKLEVYFDYQTGISDSQTVAQYIFEKIKDSSDSKEEFGIVKKGPSWLEVWYPPEREDPAKMRTTELKGFLEENEEYKAYLIDKLNI